MNFILFIIILFTLPLLIIIFAHISNIIAIHNPNIFTEDELNEYIKEQTPNGVIFKDEYGNIKNPQVFKVISDQIQDTNLNSTKITKNITIYDKSGNIIEGEQTERILTKLQNQQILPNKTKTFKRTVLKDKSGHILWEDNEEE